MVMDVLALAIERGVISAAGARGAIPSASLVAAAAELAERARREGFVGASISCGVAGARVEFLGVNHADRGSSQTLIDEPALIVDVRGAV